MSTRIFEYLTSLGVQEGPPGEDEVRIVRHMDGETTERLVIGAMCLDGTVFSTEVAVADDDDEVTPEFLAECAMRHFHARYEGHAEWPGMSLYVATQREGRA